MPPIGKDLALQFAGEQTDDAPQMPLEAFATQACIAERDGSHELLLRQGTVAHLALQLAHMLTKDAQETLIEGVIRPFQDQRRLADEGHESARRDLWITGDAPIAE